MSFLRDVPVECWDDMDNKAKHSFEHAKPFLLDGLTMDTVSMVSIANYIGIGWLLNHSCKLSLSGSTLVKYWAARSNEWISYAVHGVPDDELQVQDIYICHL